MIRRDYILRMIEEFIRALARINSLKRSEQWEAAASEIDEEFQRLIGKGADELCRMSDTELLGHVMNGEATQGVRDKCLLLTTLLRESGSVRAAQNQEPEAKACFIKALNLLLGVFLQSDATDIPEFVPRVEELLALAGDAPLPSSTNAGLMHHFERIGEFAKAEDRLFALIDGEPGNALLKQWGLGFYERLLRQSDAALLAGNLPRSEVEAGAAELRQR